MLWPLFLIVAYIWVVVKFTKMFRKQNNKENRERRTDLQEILGRDTHRELRRRAKEIEKFYK